MQETSAVTTSDEGQLIAQFKPVIDQANALTVNGDTINQSAEMLKQCKQAQKAIKEYFKPIKSGAKQVHSDICAKESAALNPFVEAESTIKGKQIPYFQEQERIRQEAEAKAQEAQRKADEEARLAAAAELEASGESEAADQVLEQPTITPTNIVPKVEKPTGISTITRYNAEVVSLKLLVEAIAAGKAPLTLVQPDTKVLRQMAVALKDEFKVPGVRVTTTTGISSRT